MSTLMGALVGALIAGAGAAGRAPTESQLEPLASPGTRERVREQLQDLAHPVRLVVFRAGEDKRADEHAVQLAKDLSALWPKLSVEVHDLLADKAQAQRYQVDQTPATALVGDRDYGIRFYGVAGGHEFDSLIATIRRAGARDSGLSEASRKALAGLRKPVVIEVFVTLDCKFCPAMVELANRLAIESPKVRAQAIELSAFPELAKARGVRAVPTVFLDGARAFEGERSEEEFVAAVVQAASGGERAPGPASP